jgi:hypothetical protein
MVTEDAPAGGYSRCVSAARVAAIIAIGLLGACRDRDLGRLQTIGDAGSVADRSVHDAAARDDLTFHFRCDVRVRDPGDQSTVIEQHDYIYWFCSPQLELEVRAEPIQIVEDDGCLRGCEFSQWKLDVDGVSVGVRLDGDSTDLIAHGFREADIESVVYPEATGHSARRVYGNNVKRETDLIVNGNRVWHLHFGYDAPAARVTQIDQMIDRAHIPACLRSAGCVQ